MKIVLYESETMNSRRNVKLHVPWHTSVCIMSVRPRKSNCDMNIDLSSSTVTRLTSSYAGSTIYEPQTCTNELQWSMTGWNYMFHKCFILHREVTSLKLDVRYEYWSEQLNCDLPDIWLRRFDDLWAPEMHKEAKMKHDIKQRKPLDAKIFRIRFRQLNGFSQTPRLSHSMRKCLT